MDRCASWISKVLSFILSISCFSFSAKAGISLSDVVGSIPGVSFSADRERVVALPGSGVEIRGDAPYIVRTANGNSVVQIGGNFKSSSHELGIVVAERMGEDLPYEYSRYYLESGQVRSVTHCLGGQKTHGLFGGDSVKTCYLVTHNACSQLKGVDAVKANCQSCKEATTKLQETLFPKNSKGSGAYGNRYRRELAEAQTVISDFSGNAGLDDKFQSFTKKLTKGTDSEDSIFGLFQDIQNLANLCHRFGLNRLGTGSKPVKAKRQSGDQ